MRKKEANIVGFTGTRKKISTVFVVFLLFSVAATSSKGESEKMREIKKSTDVKVTVMNPMALYPTRITESNLKNMGCAISTREKASIEASASELKEFSSKSDAAPLKSLDAHAIVEFSDGDGDTSKFVFRRFDSVTNTTSGFFNDAPISVPGDVISKLLAWTKERGEEEKLKDAKCRFIETAL